jgi:catechol 2,3-dioxygenase-like lactoylglutathione lyase family enzyme
MRALLILSLLPPLLWAADLKIDHVTIAGSSLKEMQANLSAAGIPSVYGGAHTNGGTEMALVSFPDGSYLELMAPQAGADARLIDRQPWAKFLRGNGGPCAWAAREKDLAGEVARLRAAGIPVSAPVRAGRQRPDGARLEWETSDVGAEVRGAFFPFLIRDLTERGLRAFPRGKPGNRDFRGIAKVVIAVRDLDAAIKRYRQAYGVPAPMAERAPRPVWRSALRVRAGRRPPRPLPRRLADALVRHRYLLVRFRQAGLAPGLRKPGVVTGLGLHRSGRDQDQLRTLRSGLRLR